VLVFQYKHLHLQYKHVHLQSEHLPLAAWDIVEDVEEVVPPPTPAPPATLSPAAMPPAGAATGVKICAALSYWKYLPE